MAPSSHNTQCWKFRLEDGAISILPDLSRRCPAVDPDDHHLFVSLGCAAENLIQAALANGLKGHAGFDAAGGNALRVALEPTRPVASTLFQAIPERQSTRGEYDGQPLARQELDLLEKAGSGDGVQVILLTERQAMEKVLEYVVKGNTAQMNNPAFVSDTPGPARWVEVGRCFERFALQSAALGIRNAMLNQPVEVSTLPPQFAAFLGVGKRRPDLVVRCGRGPKLPSSLRCPVQAMLA